MKKIFALSLILSAGVFVSGCTSITSAKKEAFAKPPKIAVVSMFGSVHNLYTDSKEDGKILAEVMPTCLSELSKSKHFRLLPANAALSSKSYAAIKDDPSMFLSSLPGYKQFSPDNEKQHLQSLARELHVDGFMLLSLNFSKETSGVSVGPLGVGSTRPVTHAVVGAYTAEGESIWSGQNKFDADEGNFALGVVGFTVADYQKMIGQLKGLTQNVCHQMVQDLSDKLAAK